MFLTHIPHTQAVDLAAAIAGACRSPQGWTNELQPHFLQLIFQGLLRETIDFESIDAIDVATAAQRFPTPAQRTELVELLVLTEMLVNPVPPALEQSIEAWAKALNVEDRSLVIARDVVYGSRAQAKSDFYRLMWILEF